LAPFSHACPGALVHLPVDDLHQRGLARAVAANQAVYVPLAHVDVHILKRVFLPIALAQAFGAQQHIVHAVTS
jgi:hypothetical protein